MSTDGSLRERLKEAKQKIENAANALEVIARECREQDKDTSDSAKKISSVIRIDVEEIERMLKKMKNTPK